MLFIVRGITILFDWISVLFARMNPLVGLCVFSAVAGYGLMKLFYACMNKSASDKAKDRIKAHLLEMVIYRQSIRVSLSSLGKIMRANCVYLRTTLIPLAVILVPCILIMGQLNLRYGARPLNIGENTVLKIVADNDVPLHDITVELSDGLQQSTPLLRIVQNNEINVKVEAVHSGEQTATVKFSDEKTCQIMIYVETTESKLSSGRYKSSVMNVLYPGNKPIKNDVPLQSITVNYAENMYSMFGWDTGWLVIFCCVSIFAGIILKLMGL